MSPSGRLVVVGTGLIGGSIALGARDSGFAGAIVGVDASQARLDEGREAGVFDETGLPQDLCAEDLVVVATPTLTVPGVLNDLAGLGEAFAGGATVTDVASVKGFRRGSWRATRSLDRSAVVLLRRGPICFAIDE